MSTIIIVVAILLITIGIAFYAGHGHSKSSISEFLVGGRTFPAWLVFFLAVGEIYSIGTLIAFPSGIYAKGAGYGVWFIAYILLAYVFGYFLAPLILSPAVAPVLAAIFSRLARVWGRLAHSPDG